MDFAHGWFRMMLRMFLGSNSHDLFWVFEDFGENSKKGKPENLGKHEPIRRNVGHPRCGIALRHSVGYLAAARPRAKKAPLGYAMA